VRHTAIREVHFVLFFAKDEHESGVNNEKARQIIYFSFDSYFFYQYEHCHLNRTFAYSMEKKKKKKKKKYDEQILTEKGKKRRYKEC